MKKTIKKQSKNKANKKAGSTSDLFSGLFSSVASLGLLSSAMKAKRDQHLGLPFEMPIEYKCGYLLKDKATLFVCNDRDKLNKWINSNYFEEYENIKVFKNNSITADRIMWRFDDGVNTDPEVLAKVRDEYIKQGYTFWTKKKYYYIQFGYSKLIQVETFRFDGLKLVVVA
jgi:hypothetical protein